MVGNARGLLRQTLGAFFQRQLEALEANRPFDQHACDLELLRLEDGWAGQTEPYPAKPEGDSAQLAGRLFEKYMLGDLRR